MYNGAKIRLLHTHVLAQFNSVGQFMSAQRVRDNFISSLQCYLLEGVILTDDALVLKSGQQSG